LENAIPNCGDLHIDAGTKKLILNLLSSIRSVVPVAGPPEPEPPVPRRGDLSLDDIRNVIVLARMRSAELEGIFNPDELLRYTRYVKDYQDIIEQLDKILEEMKSCRDSALRYACGMALIVQEHLELTAGPVEDGEKSELQEGIRINNDGIKLKVV
jgi:hypothetical protein